MAMMKVMMMMMKTKMTTVNTSLTDSCRIVFSSFVTELSGKCERVSVCLSIAERERYTFHRKRIGCIQVVVIVFVDGFVMAQSVDRMATCANIGSHNRSLAIRDESVCTNVVDSFATIGDLPGTVERVSSPPDDQAPV